MPALHLDEEFCLVTDGIRRVSLSEQQYRLLELLMMRKMAPKYGNWLCEALGNISRDASYKPLLALRKKLGGLGWTIKARRSEYGEDTRSYWIEPMPRLVNAKHSSAGQRRRATA
jgi:hypothetical protein